MVLPQAMAWVQYWFRVLSLKFCGKSKKICGDISQLSPAFCMYALNHNIFHMTCSVFRPCNRFCAAGYKCPASSLKSQQISASSVKSSLFFQAGDSVLLVTNLRPHPPRFCPLSWKGQKAHSIIGCPNPVFAGVKRNSGKQKLHQASLANTMV